MKFLLLLALIGSACALQYPVEYKYQYEGRVATGIPGIRPQVAAIGIKTPVIVQIKTKTQAIVKLTDVQSGEYNDDLECSDLRQPVPLHWSPMPQYKDQLEQPFAVSFQQEKGQVMKVTEFEEEFVRNIRKAVVEALRVQPVLANLGGAKGDRLAGFVTGGDFTDSFAMEEETIFGRCESQYTLARLPQYSVDQTRELIERHLKEDEQSEKSARSSGASVPRLKEKYWRLFRVVDFDRCHDRVILQHAGVANMSRVGHGQFNSVQSRSSVGTFILKGEPGAFRIERATIEGDIIANPFGFKTHQIQTITNQTLVLESAGSIKTPLKLPSTRDVKTWRYEVASPFSPPEGHPKPWVNYKEMGGKYSPIDFQFSLLGQPHSPSELTEYKKSFLQLLDQTVSYIYQEPSMPKSSAPSRNSTNESQATTNLHYMSRLMRHMPLVVIQQLSLGIFAQRDQTGQRKQMLFSDIAAASGAAAPIHFLLEKMKSGHISSQRRGSIFMTITNNCYAPNVIPELVEYAKSLDINKEPVEASSALVNVASLIERVCFDQGRFNYSVPNPLYGSEACKPSQVMNSFLPYLVYKAEYASKSWERSIAILALINLGSPKVIPVLKPFIYGHKDSNPRLRTIAIYGLTKRHWPESMRKQVFDILMEIVDNIREEPEIRQSAFSALLTWKPNSAWMQRMARQTWREPSQSMAAYITSTFEGLAEATDPSSHKQSRIAAFVLPRMKKLSPSTKRSYNFIYSSFNHNSKAGVNAIQAYIQALQDDAPSESYSVLQGNFGDLHLQIFKIAIASFGLDQNVYDFISSFQASDSDNEIYTPPGQQNTNSRYVEEISKKMKDYVGTQKSPQEPWELILYLRAFENIYQYIPLNEETLEKLAGKGGSQFIGKLLEGYTMNVTKFLDPVQMEYFVPTEIGLPVMGTVSMPTMNLGDVEARLFTSEIANPTIHELLKAKNVTLLFKSNYKYMSKLIVKMQVPVPWKKTFVECGIDNLRQINMPAYGNLTLNHTSEIKTLTLNLSPSINSQFPLVYGHNIPYSEHRNFIPPGQSSHDYKVIAIQKDRQPSNKVQQHLQKKYTGLDFQVTYQGDEPYPVTSGHFMEYVKNPDNFPKLVTSPTSKQWQLSLNLRPQQTTRNITFSLSFLTPAKTSGGSQRMPSFSAGDTIGQKLEKLRSLSQGSQVYGLNAELMFNGTEFRKYEALLAFTQKNQGQQKKEFQTVLAAMASRIPGYTQSPKALCAKSDVTTPSIESFEDLKRVVQSQPQQTVRGEIYYGSNCAASQIASYRGSAEVSSERLRQIHSEMTQICNYDQVNPVVKLQTPAVYDQGNFQLEFSKEKIPQLFLNMSYSAQQYIEGATYPKGYYNNMHRGQQNKISITFKRPLSSRGYTIWADQPQKYSIFSEIRIPDIATRIVPFIGLNTHFNQYQHVVDGLKRHHVCKIQSKKVITYDSKKYTYDPLPCWTTAVIDSRSSDDFVVNSRMVPTGKFEAQIVFPKDHMTATASPTRISVNGMPIPLIPQRNYKVKNHDGQVVMVIRLSSGSSQVEIPTKLTVKVSSEIQILPKSQMKGFLRGLCGDFDGQTTFDNTGPGSCIYTDMELFKYAWTIPAGDQCNTEKVIDEHRKVDKFQQVCPKRPDRGFGDFEAKSSYESKAINCYQNVYSIRKSGSTVCASIESVQKCTPQCDSHGKQEKRQLAKCWLPQNLPSEVRAAEGRGYLTHPVSAPAKFGQEIKITVDSDCRPKQG